MAQVISQKKDKLVFVKLVDGSIGIGKDVTNGVNDFLLISMNQTETGAVSLSLVPVFFPFSKKPVFIKDDVIVSIQEVDETSEQLVNGYYEVLNPSPLTVVSADALNELQASKVTQLDALLRRGGTGMRH